LYTTQAKGGRGEIRTREKVRGTTVHTAGSKIPNCFGVYIVVQGVSEGQTRPKRILQLERKEVRGSLCLCGAEVKRARI
jgi:hypothetical protein